MEIEGAITFSVNSEYATIGIRDVKACSTLLRITLTPEQLSQMLSRLAHTSCEKTELFNLDKAGKVHENKKVKIEKPKKMYASPPKKYEEIYEYVEKQIDPGWTMDRYLSSQDSFVYLEGKYYVNVIIRRWT